MASASGKTVAVGNIGELRRAGSRGDAAERAHRALRCGIIDGSVARIRHAIGQRREIVDALSSRDEARATQLTRQHIRSGFEKRVRTLHRPRLAAPAAGPRPHRRLRTPTA